MKQELFETKIKPLLNYIGFIGAILTSTAYIFVVIVLIFGFSARSIPQTLIFAGVNAVVGLIIMMFLKLQGVAFAKEIPANKEVLDRYNLKKPKTKYHNIKYFWITSTIKDVVFKAIGVAITSTGLIYIVIEGSQDYNLLLLSAVNLILFICFGLMSLVNAYDYYNDNHIPYIKELLKEREKCSKEMENNSETYKSKS